MKKVRAPKRKKIRYFKKTMKVSEAQHRKLQKFCKQCGTTENKVMRMLLSDFLRKVVINDIPEDQKAAPNQLSLFE